MHIKEVRISGFKSYKESVDIDPFHEGLNVVVGRNGSGKSNFFNAIRFVMADMFMKSLRPEERQGLLHEGAGDQVMSAFVEVVFDNSDGRLPISKEEVTLRRTFGLKKDEYFLDKKHYLKHDVQNLLESAGFSPSNPYYIVQQGKITGLATMSDRERLELLKEVAGTRVYDERRADSLKIMQDAEQRRIHIDEVVKFVETQLAELEQDRDELRNYVELDRKRKSLSYAYYQREKSDAASELEHLEGVHGDQIMSIRELEEEVDKLRAEVKERESALKNTANEIERMQKDRNEIDRARQEEIKRRAKLQEDVHELIERQNAVTEKSKTHVAELESLKQMIQKTRSQLERVTPSYEKALGDHNNLQIEVTENEHRLNHLYSKAGRSAQFRTKGERDAFLKTEIEGYERTLKKKQDQIAQFEKESETSREEAVKLRERSKTLAANLQDRQKMIDKSSTEHEKLVASRDEKQNERKRIWREQSDCVSELRDSQKDLDKAEKLLSSSVARNIMQGLTAVKEIAEELHLDGYYGPVIDLLEIDDRFMTAAEVTAGNKLFQVIVDNDETAARLVTELSRRKAGRVTFMPLRQLRLEKKEYPQSEDVIPLIDRLKFDKKFEKAFYQIFGKTLIARSLDVATPASKQFGFDCVTMDGDQVNRRGGMSGGFHNRQHSRLAAAHLRKTCLQKVEKSTARNNELKTELLALDQSISKILGQIQQESAKKNQLRQTLTQQKEDCQNMELQAQKSETNAEQKARTVETLRSQIGNLESQIQALKDEMGTDLLEDLAPAEKAELGTLQAKVAQQKKELVAAQQKRLELEGQKNKLMTVLESNYLKRKRELEALIQRETDHQGEDQDQLSTKQHDLERADEVVAEHEGRLAELDKLIERNAQTARTEQAKLDQEKGLLTKKERTLQSGHGSMEKLTAQRANLTKKWDEANAKIRDLGPLPSGADETYKDLGTKQLLSEIRKANASMEKYSHVNKKAMEQYEKFHRERDQLLKKKTEVESGEKSIRELMKTLDLRKDEAIQRTYDGVAAHFQTVFSQLVSGGKARLIMQKKRLRPAAEEGWEDASGDDTEPGTQLNYTGVGIEVSFRKGESALLSQLSGGQKSLVALALIFAIQRLDPAPFYLFDEIDANLDSAYRSSVAQMIKNESEKVQYIVTTFRPEIVKVADQHYGITFTNKVSNIGCVEMEEALGFVEAEIRR